jgi:class 3 adenylate cyclase
MFCDLVGSTALSAGLDPEDLREIINSYQERCSKVIGRFQGYVAKYMGDGIVAYFGYPKAHEDNASLAVHAALSLVSEVSRLTLRGVDARLQVRVGVATGLVVVGDLIGEGSSQELSVIGETPNLAARLQAIARPGTVVMAPSTHRLVRGEFQYASLGQQRLKGFAEPVTAWQVLTPLEVQSRFESRSRSAAPLVGRDEELTQVLECWARAKSGSGQILLLSGEPGIGKSRLVRAFCDRLISEKAQSVLSYIHLRYQCSPNYANSALYPIIVQLERAAGFARDDAPEVKLRKLEGLIAEGGDNVLEGLALLASLLMIPADGLYAPLNIPPQRQREMTVATLVQQVTGFSKSKPVLCVFEDVHWADPTTLEVIGRLAGAIRSAPVLLLLTYRSEFDPPWDSTPHTFHLRLSTI